MSSFTDAQSRNSLAKLAEHFVALLVANRRLRKAIERPLIFVAHSLGGLLVKAALVYSAEIYGMRSKHLRSIFISTYGILFLGTPHTGSSTAERGWHLERICNAVFPKKFIDSQPQLMDALKRNSETLQDINYRFLPLMSRFRIYSFHEGKPTNMQGTLQYIVDEESASPMVQDVERASIDTDHSHMCKFEDDSAPGFDLVAEGIQRYAGDAPSMIAERWEMEKEHMRALSLEIKVEENKLRKRALAAYPNENLHELVDYYATDRDLEASDVEAGVGNLGLSGAGDDTLPGFHRPNPVDISGISQNASHTGDITAPPLHKRTYQACIPCRNRKVRCDLGPIDEPHDPPCVRCRREAKECYFSANRRKRKVGREDDQFPEDERLEDEYAAHDVRKKGSWSSEFYSHEPLAHDLQALDLGSISTKSPLEAEDGQDQEVSDELADADSLRRGENMETRY